MEEKQWSKISAGQLIESVEMKIGGISCGKKVYCKSCDKFHEGTNICCKICKHQHEKKMSCIVAFMINDLKRHNLLK